MLIRRHNDLSDILILLVSANAKYLAPVLTFRDDGDLMIDIVCVVILHKALIIIVFTVLL